MRIRVPIALALALAASAAACDGDDGGASGPLLHAGVDAGGGLPRIPLPVDVVSTEGAIDAWPRVVPGVEARAFTSFDRGGGNDDGFDGTYSQLYEERGEHVIFDAVGPGALRTLWFTSAVDGNGPLHAKTVRFYFDDEPSARFSVDANELYAGGTAPFVTPLVADNRRSSGGFASWAPLVYLRRLVVTTEVLPGFYQAHYDTFPPDWDVASTRPFEVANALAKRFSETGFSTKPLVELPLEATRTGAGTIDVLRFEPAGAITTETLQRARIRIWFDGAAAPQVDVPLGMFFGSGLGEAEIRAVPWTMQPGRYESRFPMPYFDGARIAVSGVTGRLFAHVGPPLAPRDEIGTFTVIHREARPTTSGADFEYADVTGSGKLVGTVLTVEPPTPTSKQWWEGDLRSYADDLGTPAIHGTGHEDDHLGGWSNEFLERPFSLPMQGCPKTEILDRPAGGQTNANATMYRLYAGIPFLSRIRHSTEHGPENAREAAYASATFLYASPRVRLVLSDERVAESGAGTPLTSTFEGRSDATMTAIVHRYAAPFEVSFAIDPSNVGVKLRRLFDQEAPRQRARVIVDGVEVGAWYVAEGNGLRRWAMRDYFLPAQLTKGKSSIHVKFLPEAAFNAARFEAWSVLP